MQASNASQEPSQEAPGPSKAAAPSDAAAIAVNQAMDLQPPKLCLQLDSATQLELLPLQDPTPMVGNLIHPPLHVPNIYRLRLQLSSATQPELFYFQDPAPRELPTPNLL